LKQFVILSGRESGTPGGAAALPPIGRRADVVEKLARCNTSPESSEASDVLYGPGIRIELTPGQDPTNQMLVTITEQEIGWLVLTRILNNFGWKLLDPESGRELTPAAARLEPDD
jgi:hypothetical protein